MMVSISLLAIIQFLVIIYLIKDRQKRKEKITTESISIGGYEIKIVNGNISTEPVR